MELPIKTHTYSMRPLVSILRLLYFGYKLVICFIVEQNTKRGNRILPYLFLKVNYYHGKFSKRLISSR